MDYSINLTENIRVSDFSRVETEFDAIIYRNEFEQHHQEYIKTGSESELILAFIFLQIYVECFLHQNMRRIVELEFKPPREVISIQWLENEHQKIQLKIEKFITLFFSSARSDIKKLTDCINDGFNKISYIRNQFAHGHKIASWSDSHGNSGSTPAHSILKKDQLNQTIIEINESGSAWNKLLDNVLPNLKVLRGVINFKFSNL